MLFTLKPQRSDTTNLNQLTNKIIANVQTNTQNGAAVGGSSFFGAGGAASLVLAASNSATTVIG